MSNDTNKFLAIEDVKTCASKFLFAFLRANELGADIKEISDAAIERITQDAKEHIERSGEYRGPSIETMLRFFQQPQPQRRRGGGRPPGSRNKKAKTDAI